MSEKAAPTPESDCDWLVGCYECGLIAQVPSVRRANRTIADHATRTNGEHPMVAAPAPSFGTRYPDFDLASATIIDAYKEAGDD